MEEPKTVTLSLWNYTGLIIMAVAGWTGLLVIGLSQIITEKIPPSPSTACSNSSSSHEHTFFGNFNTVDPVLR